MDDPCSWFECGNKATARSLCKKHYEYCRRLVKKGVRTDEELVIGGYFDAPGYQQTAVAVVENEDEAVYDEEVQELIN